MSEPKTEKITEEQFDEAKAGRRVSKWNGIIQDVKDTGDPVKITGLTKGQVSAGYRTAKAAGMRVKANYKDLELLIAPAKEE